MLITAALSTFLVKKHFSFRFIGKIKSEILHGSELRRRLEEKSK